MTKIKLCGISRLSDVETINEIKPEYIGFVFSKKSRRYVDVETALELRKHLHTDIKAVGVFVNEPIENVVMLLNTGIIDIAQLHGDEDDKYINDLRQKCDKPIIKAFCVKNDSDICNINNSNADYVLLDSGTGSGVTFDWRLIKNINRPYFLAGGLDANNVREAVKELAPYAVDVSSGIETDGVKDKTKMKLFVDAVRKEK